jgi:hypothetical protein
MTFSEDEVHEIIAALDTRCWSCRDLQGEVVNPSSQDGAGKCTWCDGSGYTLTTAGAALLGFIRRHGGKGGE